VAWAIHKRHVPAQQQQQQHIQSRHQLKPVLLSSGLQRARTWRFEAWSASRISEDLRHNAFAARCANASCLVILISYFDTTVGLLCTHLMSCMGPLHWSHGGASSLLLPKAR
jgi:hypothetical protein